MLDVLIAFVEELRRSDIEISLSEIADAGRAIGIIDITDRAALKNALEATLVKDSSHLAAFDLAFEIYFSLRQGNRLVDELEMSDDGLQSDRQSGTGDSPLGRSAGAPLDMTPEELAAAIFDALRAGSRSEYPSLAWAAVVTHADIEPGRPVGGTYYLYKVLKRLDLDAMALSLVAVVSKGGGEDRLGARLVADEIRLRVEGFTEALATEIRRQLVDDRGALALANSVRRKLPKDVDLMSANREELAALRRALAPLSRKLAARLARRRRHLRRGSLDFRSTIRHSLSAGGVPIDPRFRSTRPAKPEIMVIADISGSVASFARFTLALVHSISAQFSKVRSFVFVDGIDEVTNLMSSVEVAGEAAVRVMAEANVVWLDGHSNYGNAFIQFWDRWGRDVGPRTTVLILGDARNNYHPSQAWVVGELKSRARRVVWLNPEPRSYWGTGDSIIEEYATQCDEVRECRTLRHLEQFVGELA